ncbi:unnamed protein product [Bursaphelenchus okinawaensis]|uniref:Uncharacterized protein n=1 Tax=Bursaphelenchus okinawaensis TaxID=465554 RepID=A0A811L961_9BILA|nr:unnamed protein product [Bursaphelenchus okinawaensis]CAG9120170.1 unnamed protein product [Bursaphelenchus okinawaensis]
MDNSCRTPGGRPTSKRPRCFLASDENMEATHIETTYTDDSFAQLMGEVNENSSLEQIKNKTVEESFKLVDNLICPQDSFQLSVCDESRENVEPNKSLSDFHHESMDDKENTEVVSNTMKEVSITEECSTKEVSVLKTEESKVVNEVSVTSHVLEISVDKPDLNASSAAKSEANETLENNHDVTVRSVRNDHGNVTLEVEKFKCGELADTLYEVSCNISTRNEYKEELRRVIDEMDFNILEYFSCANVKNDVIKTNLTELFKLVVKAVEQDKLESVSAYYKQNQDGYEFMLEENKKKIKGLECQVRDMLDDHKEDIEKLKAQGERDMEELKESVEVLNKALEDEKIVAKEFGETVDKLNVELQKKDSEIKELKETADDVKFELQKRDFDIRELKSQIIDKSVVDNMESENKNLKQELQKKIQEAEELHKKVQEGNKLQQKASTATESGNDQKLKKRLAYMEMKNKEAATQLAALDSLHADNLSLKYELGLLKLKAGVITLSEAKKLCGEDVEAQLREYISGQSHI